MQEPICLPLDFNPWAALTGETQPTITFVKRGRGRPRKHNLPVNVGRREHKMGDHEIKQAKLGHVELRQMIEFFKIERERYPLQDALNITAARFDVTYSKAYDELGDYF